MTNPSDPNPKEVSYNDIPKVLQRTAIDYANCKYYSEIIQDDPEAVISTTVQRYVGEFAEKYQVVIIGHTFDDDRYHLLYVIGDKDE